MMKVFGHGGMGREPAAEGIEEVVMDDETKQRVEGRPIDVDHSGWMRREGVLHGNDGRQRVKEDAVLLFVIFFACFEIGDQAPVGLLGHNGTVVAQLDSPELVTAYFEDHAGDEHYVSPPSLAGEHGGCSCDEACDSANERM